jgi:hypothetical protein
MLLFQVLETAWGVFRARMQETEDMDGLIRAHDECVQIRSWKMGSLLPFADTMSLVIMSHFNPDIIPNLGYFWFTF